MGPGTPFKLTSKFGDYPPATPRLIVCDGCYLVLDAKYYYGSEGKPLTSLRDVAALACLGGWSGHTEQDEPEIGNEVSVNHCPECSKKS